MPPRLVPQLAMDERAIENAELQAALDRHLQAKDNVAEATLVRKEAKERIDGILAGIDFPVDSALRVGRFRITKTHVPGRSVSFDTEPTNRVRIALIDEG